MSYTDKLKQVDELQQKIIAHGKLSDAVKKKIDYKFRLDWNYYSNRMEGGTLTRAETRSVMVGNIEVSGKPLKDVLEMNGHDKVVLEILKIGKGELRLAEKRIKEIHKAIIHEEDTEKAKQIGEWKFEPNEIINYRNEKISFASPAEVSELIHKLLDKTNAQLDAFFANKKSHHPVEIASLFHIGYLTIHPFYDGNGRTARILSNLLLIACGFPPIVIKENHKKTYYQYLADIQAYGGNHDLFYEFVCDRLLASQQLVLDAIEGKNIDEPDDIDKRIEFLKKQLTNPDVVTQSKSLHSTNEVLRHSILPLLQNLETRLEKFADLFNGIDKKMNFTDYGTPREIANNYTTWEYLYDTWLKGRTLQLENIDPTGISEFSYSYYLKGFKKSLKLQYLNIFLIFHFNEFDYSLRIQGDFKTEKRFGYSQPIQASDVNEIVRSIVERVINEIEKASGIIE